MQTGCRIVEVMRAKTPESDRLTQVGFGGGCHWCTEAVFASLLGVGRVQQGFINSQPPHDQYSEAVLVDFSEQQIPIEALIEIHLRTHASSSEHTMRHKYRSAIYVDDEAMATRCRAVLKSLQSQFEKPLVTRVFLMAGFKLSEDRYRDYYSSNPNKPFCATYIEPKLALLKREFSSCLKSQD